MVCKEILNMEKIILSQLKIQMVMKLIQLLKREITHCQLMPLEIIMALRIVILQ